ncbi:MAG: hypothetical protein PHQ58_14680 [Rhodoferax sp.]|uniref:hypothetical protein n=1 Tax=Rhodoferax sp. TaxID=50421 RepID=UPI00262556EE|nr:hypothetical protein [Rhodoferax sp.]MDD2881673.1 hypothetical protein [Rhodoferax sp.]
MTSIEQNNAATTPEALNTDQPSSVSTAPATPAPVATPVAKSPAKKVVKPAAVKPVVKSVATKATPTATKPVTKPVVKTVATKTVAPSTAAKKTVAKPAVKAAPTVAPRVTAKTAVKAAPKAVIAPAAMPKLEKLLKAKKPKLVRDSFTIPKLEYLMLEELKQRSGKLGNSVKKSELIRAGIKALAALSDGNFLTALKAVPAIKTGRPTKD